MFFFIWDRPFLTCTWKSSSIQLGHWTCQIIVFGILKTLGIDNRYARFWFIESVIFEIFYMSMEYLDQFFWCLKIAENSFTHISIFFIKKMHIIKSSKSKPQVLWTSWSTFISDRSLNYANAWVHIRFPWNFLASLLWSFSPFFIDIIKRGNKKCGK